MKKVGIFYFSGTGNTKITSELIAREFIDLGWDTAMHRVEEYTLTGKKPELSGYELVGIGCPVIGYGVPSVVRQFVKSLAPLGSSVKAFVFRTAGGVAEVNFNASKPLIRQLRKKGFDVFYERIFSIGSNWITKFDDAVMRQLYDATAMKIKDMCHELEKGVPRTLSTAPGLRMKMGLISRLSRIAFKHVGADAKVDQSCSACGLCVKNCPSGNIYMKNGTIKFHRKCSACLKCVYACPQKAIRLRKFRFFEVPGGYNVNRSLFGPADSDEKRNGKIPPFMKRYLEDSAF